MEPTDSGPAATLPSGLDSPTDQLICDLLVAEPMPSPEIAARLAIPARTVRHRLMRLRDAGAVTVSDDGLYRLDALAAAALPAAAAPAACFAASTATPAAGWSAAGLVAIGALAACCVAAVIWTARHPVAGQPTAPVVPPASPGWPYTMGLPGPSGW